MTHNPRLPCRFPPFYNSLVSHKKHIRAHVITHPYPRDSHRPIFVFHSTYVCQLPTPTLPPHLSSSAHSPISLSLISNPLWLP
ncbi:unnamed protein product [Hymenolepis diminuta]|uniref:Uncharacterized protein n=1 Tax=Hymenolepis diminuta TaxID=6216 RepID=A0A564Z3Y6_HYMDI|nr:unnamed protein product [Hymenolepis diminuta]